MAKCKNCKKLNHILNSGVSVGRWCVEKSDSPDIERERICDKYVPKTNADRIRSMTDEELAKFLESVTCETHGWCEDCTSMRGEYCCGIDSEDNTFVQERLKWIKSEVGCE